MVRLEGIVSTGVGKGSLYLSMPGYQKRIEELVGFHPYPGTFNILVDSDSQTVLDELRATAPHRIVDFTQGRRSLGGFRLTPCILETKRRREPAALLFPSRTRHAQRRRPRNAPRRRARTHQENEKRGGAKKTSLGKRRERNKRPRGGSVRRLEGKERAKAY